MSAIANNGAEGIAAESIADDAKTSLLSVRGVETYYGKIIALRGVDIDVRPGEIVTMIGANGAGKTTLMMTICGNPRAAKGRINFDGRDITHLPTHKIMHLSIAQSPEGRRIFPRMTVFENLQMGAILNPQAEATFDADIDRVFELFPILKSRQGQRGGTLSGGDHQYQCVGQIIVNRQQCFLE